MKQALLYILIIIFNLSYLSSSAQQKPDSISIDKYSREMILNMSEDMLMELSLEDLMLLVKKLKVSSIEELYNIILNPVVETASKKAEQTFNSPLSVTVISNEEISNSGALNIPEALRLVPGMIVREKTNGNYDVHIRGNDNVPPGKYLFDSENTITLVMIDGRTVYNNFQGGIFWESLAIGMNDIEKIEVVIGPSSALYGSNAVSGVINIITKNISTDKTAVTATAQYGNFGTKAANAAINLKKYKHISSRISTNYQHRDRAQDEYLYFEDYEYHPSDSLPNLIQYAERRYPDTKLALDRFGINAFISGDFGEDIKCDISTGIQKSKIQTIYLDLNNISLSTRESNTHYIDFRAKLHNLSTQVSYNSGIQDNAVGFYGYKFDVSNFSSKIEYDIKRKYITISPGMYFSKSIFNDEKYLLENNVDNGLFNGPVELSNKAYYVRSEFKYSDFKFVAAIRMDDYDLPEQKYWSYQFISSYNINNKNNIRIVYSRANRGPFMYDYHVNHLSESTDINGYTIQQRYTPNKNLDLETMDMLEFGFRNRIKENIFTDFTFFYSYAKDFSSSSTVVDTVLHTVVYHSTTKNIDLNSRQFGMTAQARIVFNKKMNLKFFTTVQYTVLSNFNLNYTSPQFGDNTVISINTDFVHKTTPSYYGGLIIQWNPNDKLSMNTNFYRYSKQDFYSIDGITVIDAKTIMNMKISYSLFKENSIFFNARNSLDNKSYEFPFSDKSRGLYLIGLNINL